VAIGKLAGAIAYGAEVIQIQGSFDDALSLVVEITQKSPIVLVNSINPFRIEGQKTAAFEICDVLGAAPDWLCLPVGNAGNITSYWAGFNQYQKGLPRMLGVQAAGAAPLVLGHAVDKPETIATAIRIGRPARGEQAIEAAQESAGRIIAVSDEQILSAQRILAAEGVWVEPASAAGLAGLVAEAGRESLDAKGKKIVVVCTGHGLKDPSIVTESFESPKLIPANYEALVNLVGRRTRVPAG
jgi:threonine synthase